MTEGPHIRLAWEPLAHFRDVGVAQKRTFKVCSLEPLHLILPIYWHLLKAILFILCVCVCRWRDMCASVPWSEDDSTRVLVRGQLAGVSSRLPPCGSWGPNPGSQAWGQCFTH